MGYSQKFERLIMGHSLLKDLFHPAHKMKPKWDLESVVMYVTFQWCKIGKTTLLFQDFMNLLFEGDLWYSCHKKFQTVDLFKCAVNGYVKYPLTTYLEKMKLVFIHTHCMRIYEEAMTEHLPDFI